MKEEKKEMKELKFDLELQKEVAKIGMSATLGATVVTSMFMKNKIEDLKSTIQELIELFEEQNLEHWAEMYKRILFYIDDDLEYAKYKIQSTIGGMGSMDDIVLYRNGDPLIKENNRLDYLRSKLYVFCES